MRYTVVAENKDTKTRLYLVVYPEGVDGDGHFYGSKYSWSTDKDEEYVFAIDSARIVELWDREMKESLLSILKAEYYNFYMRIVQRFCSL